MNKLDYIKERLKDAKLRDDLSKVVTDVDALIPQSETEFDEIQKFGLYPAERCQPFITRQKTPFYQLDNMAMVPKGDTANYLIYGDFEFRQLEIIYNMPRMDSVEAHEWRMNGLRTICFRSAAWMLARRMNIKPSSVEWNVPTGKRFRWSG